MASESFWWCGLCRTRVDDRRVTWEDCHEGCGRRCVVLDEEADVFAEARAWQAFRDWCDGTEEQWQRRLGMAFDRGVEFSLSSYRPKRKPHWEAKPYTGVDSDD